jgi:HEPN domain-containing protein/predicted nucleotidyltransferase
MYQKAGGTDIISFVSNTKSRAKGSPDPSGRFILRIAPGLHAALRRAAAEAGVSLNDYCARKLSAPLGDLAALDEGARAVERAATIFGERLVGIAAFGPWARRQAAAGSDVDLLVVVEGSVALTRDLYRTWEEVPISREGRSVKPHFVHVPEASRVVGGVWADVSLDAIVLFERGLRVSERLSRVRRDIVAGRIVRRVSRGQPIGRNWSDMRNMELALDHARRAGIRLQAVQVLFEAESWSDVVGESQKVVELALKGLLRSCGVEAPRLHDVSDILLAERSRLPESIHGELEALARISRDLRRDRELAFYGAEDLTPSGFYKRHDAERAREGAERVVRVVTPVVAT